ncbi:efflux transporter periplasmic adaptor subunit [Hahella sp. CCB-MM4]|uniref:efflux RND transporter periplasmic adaptor subunit n=1 Tax=Hahella sp. (strain CCB-MM4) TaxID=1926491 RepID=UPI000B9C5057|nr:efflux RND transporter periplasmic adaptor subunit [Hahella sp. CCB-MM4]OZG74693.1 efflux transporter periplasmic adaptor subunit [Hahella sp. CCB-MM4]
MISGKTEFCCIRLRFLISLLLLVVADELLAAGKPPTGVIAAPVEQFPMVDNIEALGTASANESVTVTTKITEKIVSIHFADGQQVKRGQLLVQLDDQEEQANLRSEQAILKERQSVLRRTEELFNRKVGSEADLDLARAQVSQTQSDIEAIKSRISAHRITAPFNGVVGLREVSEGALVEPDDVLTTLDDLSVMKVDFDIPVVYLSQLETGLQVDASTSAYPGRLFTGELKSISSRIDPVTRTVKARAWFANPRRELLPGMLMQLSLQSKPRDTLVVPESAVFAVGRQHFLYAIEGKKPARAKRHTVTIGTRKAGLVEITQGVEAGDFVIVHGTLKVSDGNPVKILAVDDGNLDIAKVLREAGESESTP